MNRAATPISVLGASGWTPSFAKARVRPSLSGDILSTDQSTTYVVSFATFVVGAAHGCKGCANVEVALLRLCGEVTSAHQISFGVPCDLAGHEHQLRTGSERDLLMEVDLRQSIRVDQRDCHSRSLGAHKLAPIGVPTIQSVWPLSKGLDAYVRFDPDHPIRSK